uniref:Protein draper-like isoform X2 n=1 Tax=Crassostrea virginica TaxID=6565 RepID=A0A8B8ATW0_CRAVI|nr:protein draper-like isoform X2 [Crassostrea virginica]
MFSIFFISLFFLSHSLETEYYTSTNTHNPCPLDRVWDKTNRICRECDPGFYGTSCLNPCRYPTYGVYCQKFCDCSENICSNIFGCSGDNGNKTFGLETEYYTSTNTHNPCPLDRVWDKTNRICRECDPGFYGTSCLNPCRYPTYGVYCQKFCDCSENICSNIFGCSGDNGNKTFGLETEYYTST